VKVARLVLVAGFWLLAAGYWFLVPGYWSLITCPR